MRLRLEYWASKSCARTSGSVGSPFMSSGLRSNIRRFLIRSMKPAQSSILVSGGADDICVAPAWDRPAPAKRTGPWCRSQDSRKWTSVARSPCCSLRFARVNIEVCPPHRPLLGLVAAEDRKHRTQCAPLAHPNFTSTLTSSVPAAGNGTTDPAMALPSTVSCTAALLPARLTLIR